MFTKNVIILFVECTDDEADCSKWAEVGECQKNPTFMLKSCKKSCDQCGNQIISLFCTISLHTWITLCPFHVSRGYSNLY